MKKAKKVEARLKMEASSMKKTKFLKKIWQKYYSKIRD